MFGKDLEKKTLYYGNSIFSHPLFSGYLNSMDKTNKTNFTMENTKYKKKSGLEFLNLKLKTIEGKIRVEIFVKFINSFSYTILNTCNICNIPKAIVLRLRRICDADLTFDERSS